MTDRPPREAGLKVKVKDRHGTKGLSSRRHRLVQACPKNGGTRLHTHAHRLLLRDVCTWHKMSMVHTQAASKNNEAPVHKLTYFNK
jgi:hypothetical protein